MKVVITGAGGFLARHLLTRLRAVGGFDLVPVYREAFDGTAGLSALTARLRSADAVVHLAGQNRGDPGSVESTNIALAQRVIDGLLLLDASPLLVYANSIHSDSDTPYGKGKRRAAELFACWARDHDGTFVDILFQRLFGEGGLPDYNSFVATFCDRLASGRSPVIELDRPVELTHAQDAAQIVIDALKGPLVSRAIERHGHPTTVSEVLEKLQEISAIYASGTFPNLSDGFSLDLFNTYRSFLYPSMYPFYLREHSDPRGTFVEAARAVGGPSQSSFSTTRPGVTRGNHFHLRKVERFVVVRGTGRIALRPVYGSGTQEFVLSGDRPAFVDIPTLHTHNITNIGDDDLCTIFWANEVYDPKSPDTFSEPVA